jgi:hypothetical protein
MNGLDRVNNKKKNIYIYNSGSRVASSLWQGLVRQTVPPKLILFFGLLADKMKGPKKKKGYCMGFNQKILKKGISITIDNSIWSTLVILL